MLGNYLRIALKNLLKHKGLFFINITGLSVGIACCLLLVLWVQNELSYDTYHHNAANIYRVAAQYEVDGKTQRNANTPAPLAPALKSEFPWITKTVRFTSSKALLHCREINCYEKIFYADSDVFDVFSFPLLSGNRETLLKTPDSILISERMKQKYFGDANPLGKMITLDDLRHFKITGVFKDIPANSHFRFDFLASVLHHRKDYLAQWGISNYYTYILCIPGAPVAELAAHMPRFIEKYRGKRLLEMYNPRYFLQPLPSIHLHSALEGELEPNSNMETVYIFSAIALFILLIACLNYINLSTAKSADRAREVGLRKVLGASPAQLFAQFLGESFFSALIALPPALLLAELLLPVLNSLSGKQLTIDYFSNIHVMIGLAAIILFIGLVSGIVPSLLIAAFQPVEAIRGMLKGRRFIPLLRRGLVVFQFSISILFIIGTLTMYHQLHFTRTKKLGLDKDHVVTVHLKQNKEAHLKYEPLKNAFSSASGVLSVSASDFFPGAPRWNNNYWHEGVPSTQYRNIRCIPVDHDFVETLKLEMKEGRDFSPQFAGDESGGFLLNEAALREFGWRDAVGKRFNVSNWKKGPVVGVVKDFHFNSLHHGVKPLAMYIDPPVFDYIYVRIAPGDISRVLSDLREKWSKVVPGQPFIYTFLDEDYQRLYRKESQLLKMFAIVAFLAVFTACLGLIGLAVFTAEQRTREIGIRKVLGASSFSIACVLFKDIFIWIAVANIIAWPVAWGMLSDWLKGFQFRVGLSPWLFVGAGSVVLFLAFLSIIYKTLRAASANPVESLRYE